MSWSKIHFYYAHQLAGLTATTEDANYPVSNLLDRLDGTFYKGTSMAIHYITNDVGIDNQMTADYLAFGGDNLGITGIELEDNFNDSSLNSTNFGSAVTGTGTVVETTTLTITTPNPDGAIVYSKNLYNKTTPQVRGIRAQATTVGVSLMFCSLQHVAAAPPPVAVTTYNARMVSDIFQTSTADFKARYRAAAGTIYYWDGTTLSWSTDSAKTFYTGALSTNYRTELENNGTSFRWNLYNASDVLLAHTGWVAWSAAYSNADPVYFVMGDVWSDANYGTLVISNYRHSQAATVALEFSNDNFSSDVRQAFTAFVRSGSVAVVKEFASISGRYSRLKLSGLKAIPQISLAHWGLRTEMDYADVSYDPDAQEFKGNLNVSETGYLTGVHTKYYERQIDIGFDDADDTLYQLIKTWWLAMGMGCFFVAWEKTNHSADIWIVRPAPKRFKNPLTKGGAYRDINISLLGRR